MNGFYTTSRGKYYFHKKGCGIKTCKLASMFFQAMVRYQKKNSTKGSNFPGLTIKTNYSCLHPYTLSDSKEGKIEFNCQ